LLIQGAFLLKINLSLVSSTDYILNITQTSSGCSLSDIVNIKFLVCVRLDQNKVDLNVNSYPNFTTNYVNVDIYNK